MIGGDDWCVRRWCYLVFVSGQTRLFVQWQCGSDCARMGVAADCRAVSQRHYWGAGAVRLVDTTVVGRRQCQYRQRVPLRLTQSQLCLQRCGKNALLYMFWHTGCNIVVVVAVVVGKRMSVAQPPRKAAPKRRGTLTGKRGQWCVGIVLILCVCCRICAQVHQRLKWVPRRQRRVCVAKPTTATYQWWRAAPRWKAVARRRLLSPDVCFHAFVVCLLRCWCRLSPPACGLVCLLTTMIRCCTGA